MPIRFVGPAPRARWALALLGIVLVSGGFPSGWLVLRVAADAPFSASSQINDDGLSPVPPDRWMPSLVARGGQVFVAAVVEGLWPSDLHLSRSTDAGASWQSPEPRIDADPGRAYQTSPALAILPNGTLAAAWVDSRAGDNDIYFAQSPDGGQTWSRPDVPLSSGPAGTQQWAPAITADAFGGLYAVWEDLRDGGSEIYFAQSLDGGLTWTDPNIRVNDGAHPGGFYPTVAVVSETVVAAWAGHSTSPLRNDLDLYVARSLDGGVTWTATQSVYTDNGGWNVYRPSLAAGPGGDLLLSWSDERDGFQQIYASRSLDAGQTWTDPGIRIRPTGRVQDSSSSIISSAGLGVAWIDNRNDLLQVFFARSTDGVSWSETQISGAGFGERAIPRLASDGSRLYAAWQENPTGGFPARWQVHLARSDDGGLTWNPEMQIPAPPLVPADQSDPSIVADPNGTIYAAWMDHRNAGDLMMNSDGDIYFAGSTDGGQTWTQPSIRVSDPLIGARESAPELRQAPSGRLHLVWEDRQRHLVTAQSADGGSTWTPAIRIAPDPSLTDQIYPDFVVNATGSLFVVFQGYRDPGWSAYLARSTDGGFSWATVPLPSGESRGAAVAADQRGNLYAGWVNAFSSSFMVSRSSDGGTTWSEPAAVTPGGGRLATDTDGTLYAVWSGASPSNADIYFSRSTDGAASWSPPVRLNRDTGQAWRFQPALAVGRSGSVFVAWTDDRNGNYDIYAVNSTDGGLTWPASEWRINDEVPGTHQLDPALFADRNNGIYAAWRDNRTGDSDIRFGMVDPLSNTAPRASFVVGPPVGSVRTSIVVDASASTDLEDDPSALQVRWDWESDGVWDTAWSTAKTASHMYSLAGVYVIAVEVRDTGGLSDQATATVTIDTAPPITTLFLSGTAGLAGWYRSVVNVTLTATDDRAGVDGTWYRVDGGPWLAYTAPFILTDGAHLLEVRSLDRVGNEEPVQARDVRIDTIRPTITLSPPALATTRGIWIPWTAEDGGSGIDRFEVFVDDAIVPVVGGIDGTSLSMPDGEHSIRVIVYDVAGNAFEAIARLRVDTNVFSLTGPYSGLPTFGLMATAGVAVFLLWRRARHRQRGSPPSS